MKQIRRRLDREMRRFLLGVLFVVAASHQAGAARFAPPGGSSGGSFSAPNAPSTERYNPDPASFLYTPPSTWLETSYGVDENGNALTLVDVVLTATGNVATDTAALQAAIVSAQADPAHHRFRLKNGAGGETWITNEIAIETQSAGDYWLYLEPWDTSFLPAEGTRITEAGMATAPRIRVVTNTFSALVFRPSASRIRFTGIVVEPAATLADWVNGVGGDQIFALVAVEGLEGPQGTGTLHDAVLTDLPNYIYFDRCWLNGGTLAGGDRSLVQNVMRLNCRALACVECIIGGNWMGGVESHGAIGWNTRGPFKFVNCKVWGGSIPLFFGGADPTIAGLMAEDVEIRRCWFYHPTTWLQPHPDYDGTNRNIKNAFEIKFGRRFLIEGCVFDGMEQGWQNGQLVSLKVENSGGTNDGALTRDVTLRYCVFKRAAGWMWLQGFDYTGGAGFDHSESTNRIEICHNLGTELGSSKYGVAANRLMVVTVDPLTATLHHNTIIPEQTLANVGADILFTSSGPYATGLTWRDNVFATSVPSTAPIFGDGGTVGSAALDAFVKDGVGTPTWTYTNNVHVGVPGTGYPAGNSYPANNAAVDFVSFAGGNYRLAATSPYLGTASDGGDPGADIDAVELATAGVAS